MSDLDSDIEEIQEIRGSSVARTSSQTSLRGFLSISANSQVSLDFQNITSVRTYYALHISFWNKIWRLIFFCNTVLNLYVVCHAVKGCWCGFWCLSQLSVLGSSTWWQNGHVMKPNSLHMPSQLMLTIKFFEFLHLWREFYDELITSMLIILNRNLMQPWSVKTAVLTLCHLF